MRPSYPDLSYTSHRCDTVILIHDGIKARYLLRLRIGTANEYTDQQTQSMDKLVVFSSKVRGSFMVGNHDEPSSNSAPVVIL